MSQPRETGTPEFGLRPGELRLVMVGPEWVQRFEAERTRIAEQLGSAALAIEHIGSTAVPGIVAKPILDMAVAIQDFQSGHALVPLLVAIGYEYRGEHGIANRHYFTRGTRRTHHLHIFPWNSPDWERHLRFRDRLLASPTLAARYSALKRAAAVKARGDLDRYQSLKTSFIVEAQQP